MLYKEYTKLSTRAKGVVEEMGGIENLISHYEKYGIYRNIKNCGVKTQLELEDFVDSIKEIDINSIESKRNSIYNINSLLDYYKNLKSEYNAKLGRFISDLEGIYSKQYGNEYLYKYLNDVFINPQKEVLPEKFKIKELRVFDEFKFKVASYLKSIAKFK